MSTVVTDHSINRILGLVDQSTGPPKKRQRRNRTIFSDATIDLLEKSFTENKYPDIKERMNIAKQIGEEEARVQVWFQNRRARHRRSKRSKSYGTSSSSSSSPKSSPSPPPVLPLRPTWLQFKDGIDSNITDVFNNQLDSSKENIHPENSPSFKKLFEPTPSLISPLPKTPSRNQILRQISTWSPLTSPAFTRLTSSMPAISPLPPSPTRSNNRGTLRIPMSGAAVSCSLLDLSETEGRTADRKFCFSYPTV